MKRWIYFIMPALAATLVTAAAVTRPTPAPLTAAAIDASVLFSLDREFNALRKLKHEYNSAILEMEFSAPPARESAFQRAEALENEWLAFNQGIRSRSSAIESILTENTLDKTEREYFRLRSEYSTARDQTLKEADEKLSDAFNYFSKRKPEPMLRRDKLELLHSQLNLKVLTRDIFAMPEYRLTDLLEREKTMRRDVQRMEQRFTEEIQAEFRKESVEIEKKLQEERRALEEELELAVSVAISEAERSLGTALDEQRNISLAAAQEGALKRKRMGAVDIQSSDVTDQAARNAPTPDFEETHSMLETEFMRRLTRKAPAIAERNSNSIIFNTKYPDAGSADNNAELFKEALGM